MAVFRVDKTRGYTVMSNHHLHNRNLSFKAKGLLSFMLSLPEDWNYTERGLTQFAKDGRDSIRAALSELEEEGYLKRRQSRKENGTLSEMEYVIYEQPQPKNTEETMLDEPLKEQEPKCVENTELSPWSDFPSSVKPSSGNPTILNTNIKSNNKQSNNKQNSVSSCNLSVKEVRDDLMEQIGYDDLLLSNEKDFVDNILQITLEMKLLAETMKTIRIGQDLYPSDLVKLKLSQLTYFHICYIAECLKNHKEKIRNIKAYLQKSILNAPDTMDAFYDAQVRHDLYHRRE